MKRLLATAFFATFATMASAQTTVVVSPEQETQIREYVVKQHPTAVELPADVAVEVGSTLPETVEVHSIDSADVGVKYEYVVVGERTVLVEPETRKIVHIIE